MKGKYRDKGILYWGGSGNRRIYYLIDDFVQVSFDVDREGKLIVEPLVESRGLWLKDADGSLLYPPKAKP
jgi:hypothetical protein